MLESGQQASHQEKKPHHPFKQLETSLENWILSLPKRQDAGRSSVWWNNISEPWVSQVHQLYLQPCAPTTQVVKSSTKHHENQNKFMKKKLKLHPRCLKAGLKPTQNGLISVSPQLSCPSVKDREAPSLPTVSVKTNFCLWIPQDSPSEVINNSLLSGRLSRALNVGVRMAHSGELLGGAPSSLGITGKCGPWGTAELAQVIKGVC